MEVCAGAPLPTYTAWRAARVADIRHTYDLAMCDFGDDIALDRGAADDVCLRALQALFTVHYNARDAPPPDEQVIPLRLAAFGEFLPRPTDIERHGLVVWSTSVGEDTDEGGVNDELQAWKAQHGSLDTMWATTATLTGLPSLPPGHRLSTLPQNVAGWTVHCPGDDVIPPGPVPSLAELCTPSRFR